jgi:amino acid transporter
MPVDPSKSRVGLVRALGPFMATALVVGTVIGSGIFKKPRIIAVDLQHFGLVALVWILGGVLALLGALSLSEVAVLFPRAGGNYVFLREGFGRLFGFLFGWVEFWISRSASIAALATIFTESLFQLLVLSGWADSGAFWLQRWVTVAVILGLAFVNVLGVRWGGALQLLITLVKVASLLGIMALPFLAHWIAPATLKAPTPEVANLLPFWPHSFDQFSILKVGAALVGVLWAYHGWMNVSLVAEEIKNPQRNLPLALLGGVGILITLYLGANLAYYLIMSGAEIAGIDKDSAVVTEFGSRLLGPVGAAVASAAIMCSVFGALNGNLLVGPRVLFAMSSDALAPRTLAAIHPVFRTPARAILALAAWSAGLVLAAAALTQHRLPTLELAGWQLDINLPKDKTLFDVVTDFAMFGAVIFETTALATIFALRRRMPYAERPYRCWGYPFVPAAYVVILAMILASMFYNQRLEAAVGLGFIALGAAVYYVIEGRHGKPAVG